MSDTDTILQALAQVIYQAGRLDERGLAAAPLEPPLDALLAEARAVFEQLDRVGALPTVELPRVGDEEPLAAGQVTRAQIRAALRPFVALYRELSVDDLREGDDLALMEVMVSDLERAAEVYQALGVPDMGAAMRTNAEREERALWKLSQATYAVRKDGAGYLVTSPDGTEAALDDLAALVAFADAIYERVWTKRRITPSA